MPMYACQLWSKYTQTSVKRLRAAYNILSNYALHTQKCECSPTPGQPLCQDLWCRDKKQLVFVSIFYTMHIFIQLFNSTTSNVWCFLQIFIFPQLFNTPVWRPNAVVVRELFRRLRLMSIAFV